jgi:hypothetical protein
MEFIVPLILIASAITTVIVYEKTRKYWLIMLISGVGFIITGLFGFMQGKGGDGWTSMFIIAALQLVTSLFAFIFTKRRAKKN